MKIEEVWTVRTEFPELGYTEIRYELIVPDATEGWSLRCSIPSLGESAMGRDVTADRREAERILRLMAEGCVTPVSFFDVLYDLMP